MLALGRRLLRRKRLLSRYRLRLIALSLRWLGLRLGIVRLWLGLLWLRVRLGIHWLLLRGVG